MCAKTFIAALCFLGLLDVLKEDVPSCGGEVLVVIEDVHFRQIEVKPETTVWIENAADDAAWVIDTGDSTELQFTVSAHSFLILGAQPSFGTRVITVTGVK